MDNPRGIDYQPEYEPDMDRMVKALKTVHESKKRNTEGETIEVPVKENAGGAA